MTPKEKANELALKYHIKFATINMIFGKDCAKFSVNEILWALKTNPNTDERQHSEEEKIQYWWEVLQEIEKL